MKLQMLLSYAYYLKQKTSAMDFFMKNKKYIELLIDSGAYTAYTQNTPIDLYEYMDFITMLEDNRIIFKYFTLDAIGNPEKTMRNYGKMLKKNYTPIPIFQRGAKVEHIDEYYINSDVLGMGGISLNVNNTPGYVKFIMDRHIKARKIHWLGWSLKDFIMYYKPHSFDSSSVSSGGRFGSIMYLKNNQLLTFDNKSKKSMPAEVRKLVMMTGKDPKELISWRGGKLPNIPMECTYITYIKYMYLLKEKINTKLYLVDAAIPNLQILVDTFKKYEDVL